MVRDPIVNGIQEASLLSLEGPIQRAEALYRAGHNAEVLADVGKLVERVTDPDLAVRLKILEGMATFDLGNVVESLILLRRAVELSKHSSASIRFAAALALFVRETDFQTPDEILPSLTILRQLASSIGDASALAGLHLAVARVEGLRGQCLSAYRHLEIARRFSDRSTDVGLQCCVDNVEASLESIAGNLARSRHLAQACFERADLAGFVKYKMGSVANLAVVALYTGGFSEARLLLNEVLSQANGITYVMLGALDSLAAIDLREGKLESCRELMARCDAVAASDSVPAPSWNDLAHRLTRCAYSEHLKDWTGIVRTVDEVDGELQRRQYRALRTALLCAKARALARLGEPDLAQASLAAATRNCPRGAVDPGIVLEASKAFCFSVRGEWSIGSLHYDRALATCRAIGHQYHHWWIDRDRQSLLRTRRGTDDGTRRARDVTDTALLLSDIANVVATGHSIDLLAHRVASILESTTLGNRMEVLREAGREYRSEPSVTEIAEPGGTFLIRLQGSDCRVSIRIGRVESIEEVSLLKSLVDLVRVSVRRACETESEDEDLGLWPRRFVTSGDDSVFRSPQMLEILRIAERLAATNLPLLITGETGTGKEVLARLIHERSRVHRGPFVAFNCSAVPRELVESQLFGHRRGAFTGALDSFPGVIRAAQSGTLFLDEVGDLESGTQPKLLRFLESGEIQPVGEVRSQRVTVRVVAATHADLEALAEQGRFRRDLFYRIGGARIALPPLRERKDEIPALASVFLTRYAQECGRSGLRLGDDLIAALLLYHWPGNIRQLANEIRRVAAMADDGQTLGAECLDPEIARSWNARPIVVTSAPVPSVEVRLDQPLTQAIEDLERKFIDHAMATTGGRVAEAAQLLGLSRKGLFLKRRRRGLME